MTVCAALPLSACLCVEPFSHSLSALQKPARRLLLFPLQLQGPQSSARVHVTTMVYAPLSGAARLVSGRLWDDAGYLIRESERGRCSSAGGRGGHHLPARRTA